MEKVVKKPRKPRVKNMLIAVFTEDKLQPVGLFAGTGHVCEHLKVDQGNVTKCIDGILHCTGGYIILEVERDAEPITDKYLDRVKHIAIERKVMHTLSQTNLRSIAPDKLQKIFDAINENEAN